jgi:hypothetical protein
MEIPMRLDELVIEEAHIRAELLRFDEAFCAAILQAIGAGKEHRASAFAINRATKKPILVFARFYPPRSARR